MKTLEVIQWESDNRNIVYRYPTDSIRYGSQLVVHPAQTAFFVRGGRVVAEYREGTHFIKSGNIPFLDKVVNIPFNNQTPLKAEVWFVNNVVLLDKKWGTMSPMQIEDPKYNVIVSMGAYGQYGFKIANPRLFLEKVVGNMSSFTSYAIVEYFKGVMLAKLTSIIYKHMQNTNESVLALNAHIEELSAFAKSELKDVFEYYGLSLVMLNIIKTTVNEEDPSYKRLKQAMDARANIDILGRDNYQMQRSFDVLDKAAANNNGMAGAAVGLGAGMGLIGQIAKLAASMINPNLVNPNQPTPPNNSSTNQPQP